MKNILYISLTILFTGISVFFRKLAVDKIHPYQIQIIAGILYSLLIPVWLFFMSKNNIQFNTNFLGNFYAILCLVSYVLGAVILGILLKTSNSTGTISVLISINPMITVLLSVLFLDEQFSLKKLLGCIVILSGIPLIK